MVKRRKTRARGSMLPRTASLSGLAGIAETTQQDSGPCNLALAPSTSIGDVRSLATHEPKGGPRAKAGLLVLFRVPIG